MNTYYIKNTSYLKDANVDEAVKIKMLFTAFKTISSLSKAMSCNGFKNDSIKAMRETIIDNIQIADIIVQIDNGTADVFAKCSDGFVKITPRQADEV